MSINWKITERAREGIIIINSLPFDTFTIFLNYVHRQMSLQQIQLNIADSENTLEELERLVNMPRTDFLLMIKTLSYVLRRIMTFVVKPSRLKKELREKLLLQDDNKIDAIIRLWIRQTTPIIKSLLYEDIASNEIQDVAWKLNIEISSQRKESALAVLQLKSAMGEDIHLDINHEELQQLFRQFDNIQTELESLNPLLDLT